MFRCGKATGLDHLPSTLMAINQAWCVAATIAADLLCWLRLLCLGPALADAEPKTLRYRILHTAARIVRGQRKRKIKIPESWPWAARARHRLPRRLRSARTDLTSPTTAPRPPTRGTHRPVEPAPRRDCREHPHDPHPNEDHKRR